MCGDRLKNVEIRAGIDKVPNGTIRKMLDINSVCGIYEGPGKTGSVEKIDFKKPILAKYITVQLKDKKSILQVNQLELVKDPFYLSQEEEENNAYKTVMEDDG